jgi:photosystem II stability/assembly factor-like uncharacterized protein
MYANTYPSGIFYSQDDGETWVYINDDFDPTVLAVDSQNRLYAVDPGSGIQRSTDFGLSWERFYNGLYDLDLGPGKSRTMA